MQRFKELQCIGHGSYGSAHLVQEHSCPENNFVIKKIPMELLSAKEMDQSFREVELLATLKHPNVVEYKESFVLNNVLHIVMAYCDGGDLADKIKKQQKIRQDISDSTLSSTDSRGYFPLSQVLDWFVQMAMAIKYLHDQRVLHRDLKTSNVFLTTKNVVKLGDFGIAKTLNSTLDQAKTMVGTPYYMSPEVCESKPYSYASDMWSLGCILYEMLALRHAFDAPNILTLILKIVQQDYAPIPSHYDQNISNLLHKLLDKNPDRRPSMEEIFAMPFIRHHMQKHAVSGGSLRIKVIPPEPSTSTICRRRLHPKNLAAQRRKLRLAQVVPKEVLPVKTFSKDVDDPDISNELELVEATILDDSQLNLRFPERSTTPEPLTEGKPPSRLLSDEEVDEEVSSSMVWKKKLKNEPIIVWGQSKTKDKPHHSDCLSEEIGDGNDDARFLTEAEEHMNPNFQSEYSDECLDSLRIYYSSQNIQDSCDPGPRMRVIRPSRGRRTPIRSRCVNSSVSYSEENENALGMDDFDSEGARVLSLSESSMMRELELDAHSDEDVLSDDTSLSQYEAEENFYSDDSSDFFDQSGTQYSDDFDDPDADVIEYIDDFLSEEERHEIEYTSEEEEVQATTDLNGGLKHAHDDSSDSPLKLEGPVEVQWVMRNYRCRPKTDMKELRS